jgi:hypothetical protein
MVKLVCLARRMPALAIFAGALALSVASSPGGGGDGQCGPLFEEGGAEGDQCTAREDCNEVCCLCDNGDFGFVAQGCDLDNGTCYGGDVVCQLALDDDPDLCAGDEDTDAGP